MKKNQKIEAVIFKKNLESGGKFVNIVKILTDLS